MSWRSNRRRVLGLHATETGSETPIGTSRFRLKKGDCRGNGIGTYQT